jgi:hypothetical protein
LAYPPLTDQGSIAAAVSRAQAMLSSSWAGSIQLAITLTLKAASR